MNFEAFRANAKVVTRVPHATINSREEHGSEEGELVFGQCRETINQ